MRVCRTNTLLVLLLALPPVLIAHLTTSTSQTKARTRTGIAPAPRNSIVAPLPHPAYRITDYGALGDGIQDDGAAFEKAIRELHDGDTLFIPRPDTRKGSEGFYKITDPIIVDKPLRIVGDEGHPRIKNTDNNEEALRITASNVTIQGLDIQCHGATVPFEANSKCVYAYGRDKDHYVKHLFVTDCNLSNASFGVQLKYVETFELRRNRIDSVSFAGLQGLSVANGSIIRNNISNVLDEAFYPYGIAITHNANSEHDPVSRDVAVSDNIVRNVPWEAFDTHAGVRISFTNNTATNCKRGIAIGGALGTFPKAPKYCAVVGNVVDSRKTDGSQNEGILVTGIVHLSEDAATWNRFAEYCTITGNTVSNYGNANTNGNGAIYSHTTRGLVVSGNTVTNPSPHGICFDLENIGFAVTGNTVVDCWSTLLSGPSMATFLSPHNSGYIGDNALVKGCSTAMFRRQYGLRLNGTHQPVLIGPNKLELGPGGAAFVDTSSRVQKNYAMPRVATTWDPPRLYRGERATKTIHVPGVSIGDLVTASFKNANPSGSRISAVVSSVNTITVALSVDGVDELDVSVDTLEVDVQRQAP